LIVLDLACGARPNAISIAPVRPSQTHTATVKSPEIIRAQHACRKHPDQHRLAAADALRGLAAMAVCWHHFTQGNGAFLDDGLLKASGHYGWLGVAAFFVLSGFVIPLSLHSGGYQVRNYGVFLAKRFIRLHPAYLAAVALVILLGYASSLSPLFAGPEFKPTAPQVLAHAFYACEFTGTRWLCPVFWTLAIEVQYYLLIGLVFPFLAHSSRPVRLATYAGAAALATLISPPSIVTSWLFLFLLGSSVFQLRSGIIGKAEFLAQLACFSLGSHLTLNLPTALTASATALLLAFHRGHVPALLSALGTISYSLYLVHVPVGSRVINLAARFTDSFTARTAILALALIASLAAAAALYRFVELPSQRWSSRIRYRPPEPAPPPPNP
jgi:peptidoglycan/LPS O-acetylase OafA/YrhL